MSPFDVRDAAQPGQSATVEAVPGAPATIAVILPRKPFWGARIVQVPLFRALRERHPEARILLFASAEGGEEFVRWRLGDEVRPSEGNASLPGAVRRERPDMVLNLRRKSAVSYVAAGVSGARRVGFDAGPLSRLLDQRVPYDANIYLASRFASLVGEGARSRPDRTTIPLFRRWMEERIEREKKGRRATGLEPSADALAGRVVLLPGAGRPEKRWPLTRFLALGRALAHDVGERPILVLGPRERALIDELPPDPGVEVRDQLEIGGLLRLFSSALLVVANDCGPSHLAQLSGRRFLGLYRAGFSTVEDWFLDKANSDLIATPPGQGMESIRVEDVLSRARVLLVRNEASDAIVPFSREDQRRPKGESF